MRKKKVGNRDMRDELKAISGFKRHTNYNRSTLRRQRMTMKGNDTRIKDIQGQPDYYTKGRHFQPIQVIEAWLLCHHLSSVVKYISRAGRKGPVLEDLKKAQWYLVRELARYQKRFNKCHFALIETMPINVIDVAKDWGLSFHLGETLKAIREAKNQSLKKQHLKKALQHLRAEISIYEQKETL